MYQSEAQSKAKNNFHFFHLFSLICLLFLAGCQATSSNSSAKIDPSPALHDEIFPGYEAVAIEPEAQVFAMGDAGKAFVDEKLYRVKKPAKRIKALISGIFDHADLNLLYENDANTIASETFENRAANCLSLTIMTYAMAEYAQLHVRFQQVVIPEFWVRRDGYSLLNGHINLRLYTRHVSDIVFNRDRSFQLDFDRRSLPAKMPTRIIDKPRVLAMFYNNKGADAMIKNDFTTAYAYFRASLLTDPKFNDVWGNMGLLYRMANQLDHAESTYQLALSIDDKDATTWENLAYLYSITGRQSQANTIDARIKRQRLSNPNYHFMLGETQYDQQNWSAAIKHYRKAIKMDELQHEFYFALAKTYFKQGDINRSKKYMRQAKKHAKGDNIETRYQSKLDRLSSL